MSEIVIVRSGLNDSRAPIALECSDHSTESRLGKAHGMITIDRIPYLIVRVGVAENPLFISNLVPDHPYKPKTNENDDYFVVVPMPENPADLPADAAFFCKLKEDSITDLATEMLESFLYTCGVEATTEILDSVPEDFVDLVRQTAHAGRKWLEKI